MKHKNELLATLICAWLLSIVMLVLAGRTA